MASLFFLLLVSFPCALFSAAQAHEVRSARSSFGANIAPQTCGIKNENFYCTVDHMCKPRSQRCTGTDVCIDPQTGMEPECCEDSFAGKYLVKLGHADLGLFGSKKKIFDNLKPEHQFITFRGFTYEFGKSYGVQILDIIDPQYKYKNGQNLNNKGIEEVESSYCTWDDANKFANKWMSDTKYNLFTNNCQHFANAMQVFLTDYNSPCNRPPRNRAKRQEDQDMEVYIDNIFSNCSIVCCFDENSSASPSATASSLVIAIGLYTYSILYFISA